MTPEQQTEAVIALFTAGQLGEEEAIDQMVALHRPGGLTRRGAKDYLTRGTSRPSPHQMSTPALPDLPK